MQKAARVLERLRARSLLLEARGLWGLGIVTPFVDPVGRTREATATIARIDEVLARA